MARYENKTDEELMAAYLDGDEESFRRLVECHLKPVYNFVYRISGNLVDAEDITQETFVKVWKNAKKYRAGESFRAWLYTIARRTAIDWLRKRRNVAFSAFEDADGENPFLTALADVGPRPDELAVRAECGQSVEKALAGLSSDQRVILDMRFKDGLTFEEMGEALGKPMNTVKSQCRRGLAALRRLFEGG